MSPKDVLTAGLDGPYLGAMNKYVCCYCGRRGPASMAGSSCAKGPNRRHEIVAEQQRYACRFCGRTGSSPNFAGMSCAKSPTRRCVLVP